MLNAVKQLFIAFLISLILCPPSLVYADGIQVDSGAAAQHQATVDAAQNGVPLVNIAAPNAGGLSHNKFLQFNVGTEGVILNNATAPGVSQLGGVLNPNANLGGRAASTILNEVTGTGRSNILGYTEIFGHSANYILANPNGISINGGGFINTPRATMTTGVPQFNGANLLGMDVSGGDILIHGAGVNASNIDAFELVTRVASINADIYANRLDVITGQNRYDPASGTVTPLASDGTPAPTVSIDSSALGGMYAGRIKLVGTEAGVGVNTQGLIQSTESLEMTADGRIQIKGTASSAQSLSIESVNDAVEVSGTVKAVDTATVAGQTVTVAKVDATDKAVIAADTVRVNAGTLNNDHLIAADSDLGVTADNVNNTGTLYSGGTALFSIGNMLTNNQGTILSVNDAVFEGTAAGQKMAALGNYSGVIESLDGGLTFRATDFLNDNPNFTLVEGATDLGMLEGGFWLQSKHLGHVNILFRHYLGEPPSPMVRIINSIEQTLLSYTDLDVTRNIFTTEEVLAEIAKLDAKLAADPDCLPTTIKNALASQRRYIRADVPYVAKAVGRNDGMVARLEFSRDEASGMELGSTIAAHGDILIEADTAKNAVSTITSATGDISVTASSFENVGKEIYERTTATVGRAVFNSHSSPAVIPVGSVTDVMLTPIDYAYGTLDAGGNVIISSGAVANGVVERKGIYNLPDPSTQAGKVTDVTDLTAAIPANGLFQANTNPAQNYVIETNPALTNLGAYWGSDYQIAAMGFDPNDDANKRLGDPFYETRLVREQIMELTGRRYLETGMGSDTDQFKALMDNAVAEQGALNLAFGITLTDEQVAALNSDIVWLERQVVDGQEVLVPVVYLCSASMDKIAQGGSVIVGEGVEIVATGDVTNAGLIQADNQVVITADNFFNVKGTVSGGDVAVTATDSIRNTGGTIEGSTVALKAGNDVVASSDVAISFGKGSTQTRIARRGEIKSEGDLTIEAGGDIGIIGSDVEAGGDTTLKAGGNVAASSQETVYSSNESGSGFNSKIDATYQNANSVKTGGDLTIEAGEAVSVHGSTVEAGGDVGIKADGTVSITSAQHASDFHSHGSGGGKTDTTDIKFQHTVASAVTAGGSVNVESGEDVNIHGSAVEAGQDIAVKAARDLNVTAAQEQNSYKQEQSGKGFMGTSSMALSEKSSITTRRSRIEAGNKVALEAKEDVTIQAASISSGDTTEITAETGEVSMLTSTDSEYERHMSSKNGFFLWSSKDKGNLDETIIHTLIDAKGGLTITTPEGVVVELKESTGDVRKDAELLSNVEGLEWMGDLLDRDDVDWVAVQEIHDKWSKSDGGLGMGAMLIVSLIATAVTAGAASGLAMAAMGLETAMVNGVSTVVIAGTTTAASSTQLALCTALTAGFTSLSAQAATSLADAAAGGDLGDNLTNIVSGDGLRSLMATMVLAGTLNLGETTGSFAKMGEAGKYIATISIRTATDSIVGGEELQASFLNAVSSAFAKYTAGEIDASGLDIELKILMHGAAGAASAAVKGGDPYAGALGAMVAELVAPAIDQVLFDGTGEDGGTGSLAGQTILTGSQIASVLAASLAEVDVNDAVAAARNAIMNNYLMPAEKKELVDKLEACGDDAACKEEVTEPFAEISAQRDEELDIAEELCSEYSICDPLKKNSWDLRLKLTKEGNEYYTSHSDEFVELAENKAVFHTMIIDPETGRPTDLWNGSNGSKKYIHPIYGYEVVVKIDGEIEHNAVNMGTYNHYNVNGYDNPLISNALLHYMYDIAPYYMIGNSSDDKANLIHKLIRTAKSLY